MNPIFSLIISLIAFIVALTVHEFSHALAAYLLGDNTAKRLGRLTLNPLAHIAPLGLLFLILVRFGWAKPVPFDPRNFKYPRFYSVLVGLAGPTSNFILACIFMALSHHSSAFIPVQAAAYLTIFFKTSIWVNVMLGIFNILPIPPLDGSHLVRALLPTQLLPYYRIIERFSIFLLIILLMIPSISGLLIQSINNVIFWLDRIIP